MGEQSMAEKLAAIAEAKRTREKTKADAEAKAQEEARIKEAATAKEGALREQATALEGKITEAKQGAREARDAIQQADQMLADGGLEAGEIEALAVIKQESEQRIADIEQLKQELSRVQSEITALTTDQKIPTAENPAHITETQNTNANETNIVDLKQLGEVTTSSVRKGRLEGTKIDVKIQDIVYPHSGILLSQENEVAAKWEYKYIQKPDGTVETSGCTLSVGEQTETFSREFNENGLIERESCVVDNVLRQESIYKRGANGQIIEVVNFKFDKDGTPTNEEKYTGSEDGKNYQFTSTSIRDGNRITELSGAGLPLIKKNGIEREVPMPEFMSLLGHIKQSTLDFKPVEPNRNLNFDIKIPQSSRA
jgi:hypothetical protein